MKNAIFSKKSPESYDFGLIIKKLVYSGTYCPVILISRQLFRKTYIRQLCATGKIAIIVCFDKNRPFFVIEPGNKSLIVRQKLADSGDK